MLVIVPAMALADVDPAEGGLALGLLLLVAGQDTGGVFSVALGIGVREGDVVREEEGEEKDEARIGR